MKLKMKYMKLRTGNKNLIEKVLKYEAGNNKYGFQQYETTRSFFESIYAGKISTQDAGMDQTNLLKNSKFNNKSRPKTKKCKDKNEILSEVEFFQ